MEKVNLSREDVKAIAENRELYKPSRFIKAALRTAVVLLFGGLITALITNIGQELTNYTGFWIVGIAVLIGLPVTVCNSIPIRRASRAFVKHWEETGEIPPREAKKGGDSGSQ